jgi:PAS domain S-box-containing protein
MSDAPEPGELVRELYDACSGAPDLPSALDGLLATVRRRLGPVRAMATGRLGDRFEVRGQEVPGGEASDLSRLLRDRSGASSEASLELPPLGSFRVLPFGSERDFLGHLLVEEGLPEGWERELAPALAAAAPAFARAAELDGLRTRLRHARETVEGFHAVFEALPDPVVVLDSGDRVVLANRRAELLFRSAPDDSEGRRRAVQTNNLYFSAFRARSVLTEGRAAARELVLVNPDDGADLLCEVTGVADGEDGRSTSRVVYILRDITDLKRAAAELESHYRRLLAVEHELRRETERLNVIIENAGVPILVTDERSDIVLLNREAERLFDVAPAGADGHAGFRPVRANDAALTGLIGNFLLQPQARRQDELELEDPDGGRRFPARVTLTKIATPRGEPTAVVCVLHDLTSEAENQALAAKLRALNAELEERIETAVHELAVRNRELEEQREGLAQASRLKTEFLAMMSHELRTPLNSILGYSSLLSEGLLGDLSADQSRALAKTRGASEHLLSLINDILDLSKVEAGKMALAPASVPVGAFMSDFEEGCAPLLADSPLDFRVRVEEGLPPVHVDPTRLRQVLLNLVSNALKFTDEGSVELRIGLEGEDRVRFEVEDTGIGIEKENLEVIFEGFRQLEEFPTRAQKGTGLGLAISRKLVGLMGGHLRVRSVHGEGSVFWFSVPADGPSHETETEVHDGAGRDGTDGRPGAIRAHQRGPRRGHEAAHGREA